MSTIVNVDVARTNELHIFAKRGSTFNLTLTVNDSSSGTAVPKDLTGYSAILEVKARNEDDPAILTFTSDNTTLTIPSGSNDNQIVLFQTQATMAALVIGEYLFDLKIRIDTPTEERRAISQGIFEITSRISTTAPTP